MKLSAGDIGSAINIKWTHAVTGFDALEVHLWRHGSDTTAAADVIIPATVHPRSRATVRAITRAGDLSVRGTYTARARMIGPGTVDQRTTPRTFEVV